MFDAALSSFFTSHLPSRVQKPPGDTL